MPHSSGCRAKLRERHGPASARDARAAPGRELVAHSPLRARDGRGLGFVFQALLVCGLCPGRPHGQQGRPPQGPRLVAAPSTEQTARLSGTRSVHPRKGRGASWRLTGRWTAGAFRAARDIAGALHCALGSDPWRPCEARPTPGLSSPGSAPRAPARGFPLGARPSHGRNSSSPAALMFPDRIIFPKAPVCSRDAPESDSVSVVLFASRDVSGRLCSGTRLSIFPAVRGTRGGLLQRRVSNKPIVFYFSIGLPCCPTSTSVPSGRECEGAGDLGRGPSLGTFECSTSLAATPSWAPRRALLFLPTAFLFIIQVTIVAIFSHKQVKSK